MGARKTPGKWADKSSRHERGYGTAWDKLRLTILCRDQYLCQPCKAEGRPTPAREVDHIVSKSKGGTDDVSNLQSICTDCHRAKTQQEGAEGQGRRPRPLFSADGRPIWPNP
ncbi:MAG: HNH endonuclease [Paracoccaceae bacterium]